MAKKNGRDDCTGLVKFVCEELARIAEPSRAPAMAAYMKTSQPFYGVARPKLNAALCKQMRLRFVPADRAAYERGVLALWVLPHREEQYAAIEYARQHPRFIVPQSMKLYERLIRQGAWWDLVDDVAEYLVGAATLAYRAQVRPILERWIDDPDLWIRRTAIIAQVQHKGATDGAQLFGYCLRRRGENEFFIRKAIGWALRAYSKSNPEAVRDFLLQNRGTLAPLSLREGAKHLVRLGKLPAGFP
ncbi:MAG: DNA alkylation repair protein [Candidatus Binataceae bacterium]|jgi:3-methyladenine DNA glycosylase AlkD